MVETILDYFANYNRGMDNALEERDIFPILCGVVNEKAKLDIFGNMKMGDNNVANQYVVTFDNVKIYRDNHRALNCSVLPAMPINLPNRKGFVLVCPVRNMNKRVILADVNHIAAMATSPSPDMEGNIVGWKEGDKFYYWTSFDETNAPIMMFQMVVSGFGSIGMDSELSCDPAMEQTIRQEVIDYFMYNLKNRQQDFNKNAVQD